MFTIITATYNAATTLPRLLESLAAQTYRDFELIIQDGASTDDTVAVAESYRHRLPSLSIACEPDTGIYDAWNKALPRVRGEWVLFLGADDELDNQASLATVHSIMQTLPPQITFAAASLHVIDGATGSIRETWHPAEPGTAISGLKKGRMPAPHTALFHKKNLLLANRFDASFSIIGDYDFICRTWSPEKMIILDVLLSRMYAGGISENPASTFIVRKEMLRIVRRHFPSNVSFKLHIFPVFKGYIVQILIKILGEERAPKILDFLRVIRGLPPTWTQRTKGRS